MLTNTRTVSHCEGCGEPIEPGQAASGGNDPQWFEALPGRGITGWIHHPASSSKLDCRQRAEARAAGPGRELQADDEDVNVLAARIVRQATSERPAPAADGEADVERIY